MTTDTIHEPDYEFITFTVDPSLKKKFNAIVAFRGISKNSYIAEKFGDIIVKTINDDFQKVPEKFHNVIQGRKRKTAIGAPPPGTSAG